MSPGALSASSLSVLDVIALASEMAARSAGSSDLPIPLKVICILKERQAEREKKEIDRFDGQTEGQMDGLVGINSRGDISSGHTVHGDIFCE